MFRLEAMRYIRDDGRVAYSCGTGFRMSKMTYETKAYALDRKVLYGDEQHSYSVRFSDFYELLLTQEFLGKYKSYGKLFICPWSRYAQICRQYIQFDRLLTIRQAPDVSYNTFLMLVPEYSININSFDPYNLTRSYMAKSFRETGSKSPICDILGLDSVTQVFEASNIVDYILMNPDKCIWLDNKIYILRGALPDNEGKVKVYISSYIYDKKLLKCILACNGDLNNV